MTDLVCVSVQTERQSQCHLKWLPRVTITDVVAGKPSLGAEHVVLKVVPKILCFCFGISSTPGFRMSFKVLGQRWCLRFLL